MRFQVAQAIRDAIRDGVYAPGSPLGEVELAERFGVSRGPVREALVELEKECLVRSFPNRGSFVAELSENEFAEILRLRALLEPVAMEEARRRASKLQLRELQLMLTELEEIGKSGDLSTFLKRDFEFHHTIWKLSGQHLLEGILVRLVKPMFVFSEILRDRYLRHGMDLVEAARDHRLMVDYMTGQTELSAAECFTPVVVLTERRDRPVIYGPQP
ncbi:MAG: GntR family transcriptional regulator [Bryobacterales bacterium]|nr:GntR family transcriptional regulator [Bryobacteraceae bacterium]MCZ2077027.1 GntR family transcriptional regulator [Bryobacterales bacterium]